MRASAMLATHLLRSLPAPREVHLWCLFPEDIVDPALVELYKGLLSDDELQKVKEAGSGPTHTGRVFARTLVRTTLARYGMVNPQSLKFGTNKYGKPKVIWPKHIKERDSWRPKSLCFNLSHTKSLLACAVTLNAPVGVDVEEKDRKLNRNLMALARRHFSPEEAEWLAELRDPTEQHQRFMQLWTLKEAYVKAMGTGINETPLKNFTFSFSHSDHAQLYLESAMNVPAYPQRITMEYSSMAGCTVKPGLPASSWQFLLLEPSPLHVASICHQVYQSDSCERLEGCMDDGLRVKMWRTVPLIGDEPLRDEVVALGTSFPPELCSPSNNEILEAGSGHVYTTWKTAGQTVDHTSNLGSKRTTRNKIAGPVRQGQEGGITNLVTPELYDRTGEAMNTTKSKDRKGYQ